MTKVQTKSSLKFYVFRIMRVIHRIRRWLYGVFLKSELRSVTSDLFHLMIVDGKKEFLKKLDFVFKRGKLQILLAVYNECIMGIKL